MNAENESDPKIEDALVRLAQGAPAGPCGEIVLRRLRQCRNRRTSLAAAGVVLMVLAGYLALRPAAPPAHRDAPMIAQTSRPLPGCVLPPAPALSVTLPPGTCSMSVSLGAVAIDPLPIPGSVDSPNVALSFAR